MKRMTHRHPQPRMLPAVLGLFILSCLGNALADDLTHNLIKIEELQARDGDAEAQLVLGARYEDGNGVPKDLKRAVYWYKQAANQGNSEAQYKMGVLHEQGRGVKRDTKAARNWFAKAAANGHDRAKTKMLGDAQPATAPTLAKASPPAQNKNTSSQSAAKASKSKTSKQSKSQTAADKKSSGTPKSGAKPSAKPASNKGSKKAEPPKAKTNTAPDPEPAPVLLAEAPKAEAPKKEKKKSLPNMREHVIASMWQRQGSTPAELLPSSLTRCLKSSESEIVCFSKEHKRVVADSELTYTTKATLGNFTDDGQFSIEYVYNVQKITPAARRGPQSDPAGLRAEPGWQRPALSMSCKAIDLTVLRCEREGWHIVDYVTH